VVIGGCFVEKPLEGSGKPGAVMFGGVSMALLDSEPRTEHRRL
jgi:hypothetical protein